VEADAVVELQNGGAANDAALRVARVAAAGCLRGKNNFTIVCDGDSKTEGQNSDVGATYQDNYPSYLLTRLRARFQPAGVTGGVGWLPAYYAFTAPSAGLPVTQGGVLNTDYTKNTGNGGPGLRGVTILTTSGSITWTATYTSFDLFYNNQVVGTKIGVSIDGGAVTTITTSSTGGSTKFNVTGGGGTSHTIAVTEVAGSAATPIIEGIMVYNGDETAGVRLINGGHFGFQTLSFSQAINNWVPSINILAPDLIIVRLGTNDMVTNTAAVMQANLATILSTGGANCFLTKLAKKPSILLMSPENRSTGTLISPFTSYRQAYYNLLTDPTGPALLDLSLRLPTSSASDALGVWGSDSIHETSKGYQYEADMVDRFIFGSQ
jgi:lysophospholipase L1-like esterase